MLPQQLLKEILYVLEILFRNIFSPPQPIGSFNPAKLNIMLVYGFATRPESLIPLKIRLEKLGYNILIPDLGLAIEDIDLLAQRLVNFINSQKKLLQRRYGKTLQDIRDKIIFFGHSMGGLVILSAQRLDRELLAIQVVTAGTPLGGALPAYFISPLNFATWQMSPGSTWLEKLVKKDMAIHPRMLLPVLAREDEIVSANASSVKEYPALVVDIVGHAALIFESELMIIFENLFKKLKTSVAP